MASGGTYIAKAARPLVVALALLSGCGGGGSTSTATPASGPLSVYLSVPAHGVEASTGAAVAAGARLALHDAHGRAGDRAISLVQLDDSKPPAPSWDAAQVEANAKRAAQDPRAIAYIGELDEGGSAISVPVTNDAGILQVSPLDGLTTLTHAQAGAPAGTGPARYYPSGKRTFLRLVPRDGQQARELIDWIRAGGGGRLAIVSDDRVFGRLLAQQAAFFAEAAHLPVTDIAEPHDDPATFDEFALKLAAKHPDVVLYTGLGTPLTAPLLQAIQRALPGAGLYGSSALAQSLPVPRSAPDVQLLSPVLPPHRYGPRARRVLARLPAGSRGGATGAEALYGYESMRLVLDAIAAAGPNAGMRDAVARAALTPQNRASVIGAYRVLATGDVSPAQFGAYRRSASGLHYLAERPPSPR